MRRATAAVSLAAIAWMVVFPLAAFVAYGFAAGMEPGAGAKLARQLPPAGALLAHVGMTLGIGLAAGAGALAIGLPTALLLERTGAWRGRGLARALTLVPLAVPPYLHAVAWIGLFGGIGGVGGGEGGGGAGMAVFGSGAAWLFSPWGTILVLVSALWPCVAWAAAAGLRSLDPRQEEVARLAAGPWGALRRVTLPLTARHAAAGALFAAVLATAETGVPALFGTPTLAADVYTGFSTYYNPFTALVLSAGLLAIQGVAAAAAFATFRTPHGEPPATRDTPALLGGLRGLPLLVPAAAGLAAGLAVPLVSFAAGLAPRTGGGPAPLTAFARAWEAGAGDLGRTLGLALAGAAAATLLALAARLALSRGGESSRPAPPVEGGLGALGFLISGSAFAAFALPGAAVGIGMIFLYNREGLPGAVYGSAAIVALAYTARCFFIPWAGLGIAMAAQGGKGVEAARVAGLPWWRTTAGVRVPAMRAEIGGFFVLAFLFCFGELGSVLLVHPPGVDVFPWRIFDLVHYGYDATVAALGLMAVGTVVATVGIASWGIGRLHEGGR